MTDETGLAAALRAYLSGEQLAELRAGAAVIAAAAAADPGCPPGRTVWAVLAAAVDRAAPDLPAAAETVRVQVHLVNDLGVDVARVPFMLWPNGRREGMPVEVLLERTGQPVVVVPPGEPWRPIGGTASGMAQRLWLTPAVGVRPG